ncbi:hypothetical protein GOC31_31960 [Sinorhizobium meliloti]|nr:hypothetical protein [Sinorhizobium meliloti]MDX0253206.1 hypothetical protein [Sinorhizobium meliloti]
MPGGEARLTSRRSEQACAQQAMFVPVTMLEIERFTRVRRRISLSLASGRIEIVVTGARMTMIGAVAPELAQAIVAAL